MPSVCLYFQVHQPHRLRKYSYFDIGKDHDYLDDRGNQKIVQKVAENCYLPTNRLLLQLIKKHAGRFNVSFSISGTAIEQFKRFCPAVLESFQALVDTNCVELLNETYHHSLSAVFSKETFLNEVKLHQDLIIKEFGYYPSTFRNTELIYNNDVASMVSSLGYKTILAEGADKVLGRKSPNHLYQAPTKNPLCLMLKNYKLSDDIAFRFSDKKWVDYPLTADKFAGWLHKGATTSELINLFMDYETFGEHQWDNTGIFEFLEHFPTKLLEHSDFDFCLPRNVSDKYPVRATLDIPDFYSWADTERDLSAWTGNDMQKDALQTIYRLEETVKQSGDKALQAIWGSLLTSDHFYYMCTKQDADGEVHKYFSPYGNPYDAYINYQNVVKDLTLRLGTLIVNQSLGTVGI